MNDVYFTSDTHFDHENVIHHASRPFLTVEEMNEAMIANWNATVHKRDRVFHLGDFAFSSVLASASILRRLNGEIHLIRGNHDYRRPTHWEDLFASVSDLKTIKVGGQKIVLCHYALRVWESSHHGAWNLHGHSHGTLSRLPGHKQLDVGVDCWEFRPVSFDQLRAFLDPIEAAPVDHHGRPHEAMEGPDHG
jgi:calcineurin-like phosphoesterase family protein